MYADPLAGTPEYAFVPHVTVAQKLSDDEHSDVLGTLKAEKRLTMKKQWIASTFYIN
ncbi:hypothetical protein BsIDN1_21930 [Bacillus safensis]|uniref:Uncharacterized protein n=1 Tax=Bacillus safensis TaxID=561879 RepID=A0A5S9M6X4_BACIA|nr:hypothetical protein BsIDN1_21930 [Bacillus safensis]